METREIDICQYWPQVVRNTEEFQQIAEAENPEFNLAQAAIYRILKDCFIKEATEYGIGRWENMLGLTVTPNMTLDDRRNVVIAYLSTKTPYTWRVLEQMLANLLGEDNFRLSFNNETQVLTIAFASTVTDAQLSNVDELCQRVVPMNLVVEIDPFPCDFTRVEYLESAGRQYINTGYNDRCTASLCYELLKVFPSNQSASNKWGQKNALSNSRGSLWYVKGTNLYFNLYACYDVAPCVVGQIYNIVHKIVDGDNVLSLTVDDVTKKTGIYGAYTPQPYRLFDCYGARERLYWCKLSALEQLKRHYIPSLDPTGTPCLYDMVTRKPFYNSGTSDFIYPTDAAPAVSADLDEKFYAKLTEHGIRRLYHVPKGCTMSKDEYAARNGFKELVEPPMPQEGYWTPEWRETDTQLICDWIETEPPTEVTENE